MTAITPAFIEHLQAQLGVKTLEVRERSDLNDALEVLGDGKRLVLDVSEYDPHFGPLVETIENGVKHTSRRGGDFFEWILERWKKDAK